MTKREVVARLMDADPERGIRLTPAEVRYLLAELADPFESDDEPIIDDTALRGPRDARRPRRRR